MATKTTVNDILNTIVASQGLMYTKLHQFHWYIKGAQFFDLHAKLEELYDQMTADMDLVAERILAIGGEPYSTLKEFLDHSVITESLKYKDKSESEMIKETVRDLRKLGELLDLGITTSDEAKDYPTNDMLIALKMEADKQVWLLQAYLGNSSQSLV